MSAKERREADGSGPTPEQKLRRAIELGYKCFSDVKTRELCILGDIYRSADALDILLMEEHLTGAYHRTGILYGRNYAIMYGGVWPKVSNYSAQIHQHLDADTLLSSPKSPEARERELEIITIKMGSADRALMNMGRDIRNQVHRTCLTSILPGDRKELMRLVYGLCAVSEVFGLTKRWYWVDRPVRRKKPRY